MYKQTHKMFGITTNLLKNTKTIESVDSFSNLWKSTTCGSMPACVVPLVLWFARVHCNLFQLCLLGSTNSISYGFSKCRCRTVLNTQTLNIC